MYGAAMAFGCKLSAQAEYFWKFTGGAYDFNTVLNTPLSHPVSEIARKSATILSETSRRMVGGWS
jgi:hypothetical protein